MIQSTALKTCRVCDQDKELSSSFNKRTKSKDGYQNICKRCSSELGKEHYLNNKVSIKKRVAVRKTIIRIESQNFVISYLKEHPCVDCGESDVLVLDFDHISNKKMGISQMVNNGYSIEDIKIEMEKCVIRCANCHRRKTAKDFNWYRLTNINT